MTVGDEDTVNKTVETTTSMCPECKKIIPAQVAEQNGSVFMFKTCPIHGDFKVRISKYAWYYNGLNRFYETLFPQGHALEKENAKNIQFHPTAQCNLQCPVCYSGTISEDAEQIPLQEIRRIVGSLKGSKWIGLLGGEPTERPDLLEIIKIFARAGHKVILYTNGIKLLDRGYVRQLKRSGVHRISLSVDSLSDEAIYLQMRKKKLLQTKKESLRNLEQLKIGTEILNVIVKGLNEKHLGEIFHFCRDNEFVTHCTLRGYSHMGRRLFSSREEFTMDELVEVAQEQTRGSVTLEEFYLFQRLLYIMRLFNDQGPQCYVRQSIYIPRKKAKKIRDIFPPDTFNRYLDEFLQMYQDEPIKAKRIILRRISYAAAKNPLFFVRRSLESLHKRAYILLEISMFYSPYTLDIRKTQSRCSDIWFPSYQKGPAVDYCSFLCGRS